MQKKSIILPICLLIILVLIVGCTSTTSTQEPSITEKTTVGLSKTTILTTIVTPTSTYNPWKDYSSDMDRPGVMDTRMVAFNTKTNATNCIVRLLGGYDLSNLKELSYTIDCDSSCKWTSLFNGNEIIKGSTKIISNPSGWNKKHLVFIGEFNDGKKQILLDVKTSDQPLNDYEQNIVTAYRGK